MQWTLTVCITIVMRLAARASAQYAVPMAMYAMPPAALPVLVPAVAVHSPHATTTTTTTTTTTARSVALAVPVPVQMGVPFAMAAYAPTSVCQAKSRPPSCPPCPPCLCLPSCTPAFFSYCSPCHQRCRCRGGDTAPLPVPPALPAPALPVPLPAPPPVLVVPFPPSIRLPKTKHRYRFSSSDTSTDDSRELSTDDSTESGDSDYLFKRARKRKKFRPRRISARRNNRPSSDSEVVKPVLSYVSKDGDVKFETRISNMEAARLLDQRISHKSREHTETVKVFPEGGRSQLTKNARHIASKSGPAVSTRRKGKNKRIVFRSPANKKITNLSVSFQVTE